MNTKKFELLSMMCLPFLMAGVSSDAEAAPKSRKPAKRPNVLLIISDDQGIGDFGFTGNPLVKTPNLDGLAAEAAHFNNFLACPASSPTRSTLYTGRFHLETGVWVVPPRANIREDETLMPQFFSQAGYRTMLSGKHDSTQPIMHPTSDVWDEDCGVVAGNPKLNASYVQNNPDLSYVPGQNLRSGGYLKYNPEQGMTVDYITENALDFIERNKENPWFLTLAYTSPHMPWVCKKEYAEIYKKMGLPDRLATCWGEITQMDEAIGKVLGYLEEEGLEENTIVFFISDNGPTSEKMSINLRINPEGFLSQGEDWPYRNYFHLRGLKSLAYENGIHVPLLVRWPSHIEPGLRGQLVGVEDILPTMLELTGINEKKVEHQPFTGTDFSQYLFDPDAASTREPIFRTFLWELGPNFNKGIIKDPSDYPFGQVHMVLRGERFKYNCYNGKRAELYDIQNDPQERYDVSGQYPEVFREMATQCEARWNEIIATGRAYKMPALPVGLVPQSTPTLNRVSASPAFVQKFEGQARLGAGSNVIGFADSADCVYYDLDVRATGDYNLNIKGSDMDKCQKIIVVVDGKEYQPDKITPSAMFYKSIKFKKSSKVMFLKSEGKDGKFKEASLSMMDFKNNFF